MPWFYLSFCDGDRPPGEQFLGGCYVEASDGVDAVRVAHRHGCNPGGEVLFVEAPADHLDRNVAAEDRYRLLAREELG